MDAAGQLGQGRARAAHEVEQQDAGEHAVAGGGQLAEHDVARLLAAEGEPVGVERLEDVAVADLGLAHGDAAARPWPGGNRGWS